MYRNLLYTWSSAVFCSRLASAATNAKDMSEFIAAVQNRFVFQTCVSRCRALVGFEHLTFSEQEEDIRSLPIAGYPAYSHILCFESGNGHVCARKSAQLLYPLCVACWKRLRCSFLKKLCFPVSNSLALEFDTFCWESLSRGPWQVQVSFCR